MSLSDFFVCLGVFVFTLLIISLVLFVAMKEKLFDEVDARKVHTGNVPRLGGLGLFLSCGLIYVCHSFYIHNFHVAAVPLILGGAGIWLCGVIDDFINLRARVKFLIQIIVVTISIYFSRYYMVQIFGIELPVWLGKTISILWVLFLINAFNLIDGLDWLCSGISFLSIGAFSVLCLFNKINYLPGFILCAAILAFMFFNRPPAKIFLGDGGSLTLGYCVAVLPFYIFNNENFQSNLLLIQILVASVPITDVLSAIIRRIRNKKPIFSPDRAHIHHKLLNIGFSKIQAIACLLTIQFLICLCVIFTHFMVEYNSLILLIMALFFVLFFFIVIHFLNRSVDARKNEDKKV